MASKKFAAKALVNITHNKESFKVGDTMKVTLADAKELVERGYVEMVDNIPSENENDDEDPKDGE
jgi:hypothetical protein